MAPHEYPAPELEALLYQTGLNASELARLSGLGRPDKLSRWRRGKYPMPTELRHAYKALALLSEGGADVRAALERASIGLSGG